MKNFIRSMTVAVLLKNYFALSMDTNRTATVMERIPTYLARVAIYVLIFKTVPGLVSYGSGPVPMQALSMP